MLFLFEQITFLKLIFEREGGESNSERNIDVKKI